MLIKRNFILAIMLIISIAGIAGLGVYLTKESTPVLDIFEKENLEESIFMEPEEISTVSETNTSDWKTYRDEEYAFEIKYPSEFSSWEALYSPERAEIIDIGFRPEDMGGSVLMVKILDIPLQELSAYEHSLYGDPTDEKIKIGNLTATKFSGQRIGIEKNKHTFFFSSHNIREEDSEIFYQMLSTFKFIND